MLVEELKSIAAHEREVRAETPSACMCVVRPDVTRWPVTQ